MDVRITILYDNRCDDSDLQEGWGFSALLECDDFKILFDTGGDSKAFLSNMVKKSISFSEITHLIFSHRHWDHIAGFSEIVKKVSPSTALYVPKTFPRSLLKKESRLRMIKVVGTFEAISSNIYALVLRGGFWLYELALVLRTPSGLGILTGCAHPGIVQIVKSAQKRLGGDISFVLGGFHQLFTPAEQSAKIVSQFQMMKVQKVAPCHCSGDHLIRQFQQAYGTHFFKVGTGTSLIF